MLQTTIKKTVLAGAVAAAAFLGAAAPAQAAIYSGSFDPAYGIWFPDLGWSGQSFFEIPDSCVPSSGTGSVTSCGFGPMTAGVAELTLYSLSNPSNFEVLSINETVSVSQMQFLNGALVGVDAFFFQPVLATLAAAGGGDYGFSLKFSSSGAQLFHLAEDGYLSDEDRHTNGAGIGHEIHGNGHGYGHRARVECPFAPTSSDTQSCGFSVSSAEVTYVAVVPEPETYALMLAGLAAVGFMARRRRQG